VENGPPPQEKRSLSGSPGELLYSSGCSPGRKAPWALRIVFPVAGEGERRPFKRNGRRKLAGKPWWARERARKHPEALDSPSGAPPSSRQKVLELRGLGYQPVIIALLTGRRHRWLPVRREPIWP